MFHYSTKKGPNGQALACSLTDLTLLPSWLKENLSSLAGRSLGWAIEELEEERDFLRPLGVSNLVELWNMAFPNQSRNSIRKLSYFADKEGKTRVIAIFDYWSQTVLKPLHEHLNSVLKRINSDMTYNQGGFTQVLPTTGPYYSMDLTAATDRMPISLQKLVLSQIIGEDKAEV